MNRKSLREQIFKLLFRMEFNDPAELEEQLQLFFDSGDLTVTQKDRDYIAGKCTAIVEKLPEELPEEKTGWLRRLRDFFRGAK